MNKLCWVSQWNSNPNPFDFKFCVIFKIAYSVSQVSIWLPHLHRSQSSFLFCLLCLLRLHHLHQLGRHCPRRRHHHRRCLLPSSSFFALEWVRPMDAVLLQGQCQLKCLFCLFSWHEWFWAFKYERNDDMEEKASLCTF